MVSTAPSFLMISLAGCSGGEPSYDSQAQALQTLVGSIDLRASVSHRRSQLQALRALELTSPRAKKAQNTCVRGHASLLRAEVAQQQVRKQLADVPAGGISDERSTEIEGELNKASSYLAEAERLLSDCNVALATLGGQRVGPSGR